jgi:hypothetical protein
MKRFCILFLLLVLSWYNSQAQEGVMLEDGWLALKRLFTHEEPIPPLVTNWPTPKELPPTTPIWPSKILDRSPERVEWPILDREGKNLIDKPYSFPSSENTVKNVLTKFDSRAIIVKEGQIISKDYAIANDLVKYDYDELTTLSSNIKIVRLNDDELRVYRNHLGLATNDGLFPNKDLLN